MTSLTTFLREQLAAGFPAFVGGHVSLTLPISDAFAGHAASALLPASAAVRRITLQARPRNVLHVRVALAKLPFLPDIPVELQIERQPDLPDSPIVALRIVSIAGLPGNVAFLLQFIKGLPSELSIRGNVMEIDVRALARRLELEYVLRYITRLNITTIDGAIVVGVEGGVPPIERDVATSHLS